MARDVAIEDAEILTRLFPIKIVVRVFSGLFFNFSRVSAFLFPLFTIDLTFRRSI